MELQTQQIEMIANFAKANKVNRAKLKTFAADILATVKTCKEKQIKEKGQQGRPTLEKTKRLQDEIILSVKSGFQGRDASLVRKLVGVDQVTFNNALHALIKQGRIIQGEKVQTGKRGRQPFKLMLGKI